MTITEYSNYVVYRDQNFDEDTRRATIEVRDAHNRERKVKSIMLLARVSGSTTVSFTVFDGHIIIMHKCTAADDNEDKLYSLGAEMVDTGIDCARGALAQYREILRARLITYFCELNG